MTNTTTTATTERLGDVRARQSLWVRWMADATAGLSDDDLVDVTTNRTPVGNYLVGLAPAVAR